MSDQARRRSGRMILMPLETTITDMARRCQVCFQLNGKHSTVPHVYRQKPDDCLCGHERDEHEWVLPCGCRTCSSCVRFVGTSAWSCDRWLKGQR